MNNAEQHEFGDMLTGLLELYGRKITPAAAGLWWEALRSYPLAEVRRAFSRYCQDPDVGRYPPTPAVMIGLLTQADAVQRLAAEEAWAVALEVFDEAKTVCTTDEILEAAAAARPVWDLGDKIGARLAFKASYERIVAGRSLSRTAPSWRLSLGWDRQHREQVALEALRLNRLPAAALQDYLPAPVPHGPVAAIAGLLAGKSNVIPMPDMDAKSRAQLARLREALGARNADEPTETAEQRCALIDARRRDALAALERMQDAATV